MAANSNNLPTPAQREAALEQIGLIRDKYSRSISRGADSIPFTGLEYETLLHRFLDNWFPHSVLPGVHLFSPAKRGTEELGHEMDNLFHLRLGETNYLVVIEAKAQPVKLEGGKWVVSYDGKKKCAKAQVDAHLQTLREYLEPISRDLNVRYMAIVVSPDPKTSGSEDKGVRNSELKLISTDRVYGFIEKRFNLASSDKQKQQPEVIRVSQSPFLDLLRLSIPTPSLGHPELGSALRYVERCRRTLDQTLFKDFNPKPERWLINGGAGMGKSVLLAYTSVVLASGYRLDGALEEIGSYKASEEMATMGYNPTEDSMAVVAMSERQLDNLRMWFDFFVERFQDTVGGQRLNFYRPDFCLASEIPHWSDTKKDYAAVLLDEAHDLPDYAEHELAKRHASKPFYLVAACDRFQKLRLTNDNARVLNNFSFSGKSTRLKHIYRNPAPIYIASLALMFRWFALRGPKIIPTATELEGAYGFDVHSLGKKSKRLNIKNDAHPANSWAHCISAFPDVNTLANLLRRERLGRKDVLWVRFSDEDASFDYESLHLEFTYHNCRTGDAHKLCDKYIKGQDFPVVVIEGFPSFMDDYSDQDNDKKMWQFRRELYLCSSRATCFLYFVCNVRETPEIERINSEISTLLHAIGSPKSHPQAGGTKPWSFLLKHTNDTRNQSVFTEDEEEPSPTLEKAANKPDKPSSFPTKEPQTGIEEAPVETNEESEPTAWNITIPGPMTPREFAELVGAKEFEITRNLITLDAFKTPNSLVEVNILAKIAPDYNCYVQYDDPIEEAKESPTSEPEAVPDQPPHPDEIDETGNELDKPKEATSEVPKEDKPPVILPLKEINLNDLAKKLEVSPVEIYEDLANLNVPVGTDQIILRSVANKICKFYEREVIDPPIFETDNGVVLDNHDWFVDKHHGPSVIIAINEQALDSHTVWFSKSDRIHEDYAIIPSFSERLTHIPKKALARALKSRHKQRIPGIE